MPRLDTDIVMKDLSRQLEAAGMSDNPLVVWVRPNGNIELAWPGMGRRPAYVVDDDRIAFAAKMVQRVNHEAWCDGIWIGVWANWQMQPNERHGLLVPVPTEFMLMFKDPDGDDQVTVNCEESWVTMQAFHDDKMVEDCLSAISQYRGLLADTGVRRDQMMSPARGIHGQGAPD